jgi:phage internal scaffolding protein
MKTEANQNDDLNDDIQMLPAKPVIFCRHPHNYDPDLVSLQTGLECLDDTLTIQADAQESDINYIVQRFGVTGLLPQSINPPTFGDFTNTVSDYQTAMNLIIEADNAFYSLPAEARAHFSNSPAKFLDFMENPVDGVLERFGLGQIAPKNAVSPADSAGQNNSTVPPT